MRCTECGAEIPDDARYCDQCGTRVSENALIGDTAPLPKIDSVDPDAVNEESEPNPPETGSQAEANRQFQGNAQGEAGKLPANDERAEADDQLGNDSQAEAGRHLSNGLRHVTGEPPGNDGKGEDDGSLSNGIQNEADGLSPNDNEAEAGRPPEHDSWSKDGERLSNDDQHNADPPLSSDAQSKAGGLFANGDDSENASTWVANLPTISIPPGMSMVAPPSPPPTPILDRKIVIGLAIGSAAFAVILLIGALVILRAILMW